MNPLAPNKRICKASTLVPFIVFLLLAGLSSIPMSLISNRWGYTSIIAASASCILQALAFLIACRYNMAKIDSRLIQRILCACPGIILGEPDSGTDQEWADALTYNSLYEELHQWMWCYPLAMGMIPALMRLMAPADADFGRLMLAICVGMLPVLSLEIITNIKLNAFYTATSAAEKPHKHADPRID